MNRFRTLLCLPVAIALVLSACSGTPDEPAPPPSSYTLSSDQVTLEGSIVRVDKANRVVTIRGSEGNEIDFEAGPEVRNFDQLQVGDRVTLDYSNAVALEIKPAGTAGVGSSTSETSSAAALGATPGASGSETTTIVAEVMAIDTAANTVTVRGPRGNVVTLDVAREDLRGRLGTLKVGDLLQVSFTEAVAVNIRPRPQ